MDIVRGMGVPLEELAAMLQTIKNGIPAPGLASGQVVHKVEFAGKNSDERDNEMDEDEWKPVFWRQ